MIKKFIGFFCLPFLFTNVKAQNNLTFSGYVDAYYAYYTDSVGLKFQQFPTISPLSSQFGLNIAMLTAKYDDGKIRGTVCMHYGDIVNTSWPTVLQEANIGYKLCNKAWIDAGFFRTHFGTEGLLPKENIASSVAVGTWYEPYYQAGVKLNYLPTDKLTLNFYLLNGYNIYYDNNSKKSLGLFASYAFNENMNLNYSNYLGDDAPDNDSLSTMRFMNNVYLNWNSKNKKLKIQAGGDFGMQNAINDGKNKKTLNQSGLSSSHLLTIRYQCCKKEGIYVRAERFNDAGMFLATPRKYITNPNDSPNSKTITEGLKLKGITLGTEYKPTDNSYLRLEGRILMANEIPDKTQIINGNFWWDGKPTNNRLEIMLHSGISF